MKRLLVCGVALALAALTACGGALAQSSWSTPGGGGANGAVVMCMGGDGNAKPCSPAEVCVSPTVTAGAYTSGFVVGGTIAIPIPQIAAGQILQSIRLDFADVQTAEFDIYQFSGNPTGSVFTDHTAPAIVAGDVKKVIPPLKLTTAASGLGTHTVYGQDAIGRALARASASDYFVIVVVGTPTLGSTSDMQFCAAYL